jgi:hypothetical protein
MQRRFASREARSDERPRRLFRLQTRCLKDRSGSVHVRRRTDNAETLFVLLQARLYDAQTGSDDVHTRSHHVQSRSSFMQTRFSELKTRSPLVHRRPFSMQ